MKRIEKHVERILDQLQSPPEEREEIKEELMTHLMASKDHYVKEGETEKQAETRALEDFGDCNLIGHGLQEAMYPFQRSLLYVIGIATLLFGVFFYLNMTFIIGEVEPVWLIIQMLVGSAVTLSAINIGFMGRHYWSLNVIAFLTAMWNGFNMILVEQTPSMTFALLFSIFILILVILCIVFVIRNSYYSSGQSLPSEKSRSMMKVSYVVNIIFGVVLCGAALFFTYGFLIFGGLTWAIMFPLSSVIAWLIFFKFQMKLIRHKPLTAIWAGIGFMIFAIVAPFAVASVM